MNELIDILSKQAFQWTMDQHETEEHLCKLGSEYFRALHRHKFAELIVRECLRECWHDATPKQIADNIREKFGVE